MLGGGFRIGLSGLNLAALMELSMKDPDWVQCVHGINGFWGTSLLVLTEAEAFIKALMQHML